MKKTLILTSAFVAASTASMAEIVINDFLSFEGFVDMSYVHAEADDNDGSSESDNSFQVDQVEISWLFDFDPITAQIDIQYLGESDRDDTLIEQAFATYHFNYGGAITAGRYASMLGFEAFEPTGLYQYSTAYDSSVVWDWEFGFLPTYAQGVKYTYEGDNTFFGLSLQDQAFGVDEARLGGDGDSSYAFEIAASIYFDNGLTYFLGGAFEDTDEGDTFLVNTYLTYETGAWLFAVELNYLDKAEDSEAFDEDGYANNSFFGLAMANYAYNDQASVTGRVSFNASDWTNYENEETIKYTLAHNYAFTDNLMLVTEVSYISYEYGDDSDDDEDELSAAVELLFTF